MLQLTLSCAVREWFVVAQPLSLTGPFPARTSCPGPRTPSDGLQEARQIRPQMADSPENTAGPDQLDGPVQYGIIDDTEVANEPLASRGTSTEDSAEATAEFADQNTMQEQVSDQLSDAEIQLQLDAAATPQQASPEVAEQPAPTKSSDPDSDTAHLEATPARGSAESSASPEASKRAGDIRRELLPSASGVPAAVSVAGGGSFFASPTTNGGIQPTTSPTTPEQGGAADGGHLVQQQQQQHDAANLRITRLEADVTTIKESIETQSSSMAQMMAMMKFMVSQEARPKSDTITEPTTANSDRPQEEAQLGTDVQADPAAAAAAGGGDQELDGQLGLQASMAGADSLAVSAQVPSKSAASSPTSVTTNMTPSEKNPHEPEPERAGISDGATSGSDWGDWGMDEQKPVTDTVGGLGSPSAKTPGVTPAHGSVNHAETDHVNTS